MDKEEGKASTGLMSLEIPDYGQATQSTSTSEATEE